MAETPTGLQAVDPMRSSAVGPNHGLIASPARPEQDADAERLRGIVALPHERCILFTDEVELNVEKLPRWRPQISVDERRLVHDDHE